MVIFIIIIFILFYVFYKINLEVKYVESLIDSKKYLVRDLPDAQKASNMLAELKDIIKKLSIYLYKNKDIKYPLFKIYIERLYSKIINGICVFSESSPDSNYTSYSVNKGEELVFCLRSKKTGKFHNLNLITYVMLHEISHIACPEYGHTPLFNKIFAFITTEAVKLGLYNKIDFASNPVEYCGMMVNSSII